MFQASSQVLDAWVVHVLAACESLRDSDVMCASKCFLPVLNDSCFYFILKVRLKVEITLVGT